MRIDDSSIRVDRAKCIACGICVDRCIMDNLRLSLAPCRQACPVGINCQAVIRLMAMGDETKAVALLRPLGPLLPLIASDCSAPCETACARKKMDGAVHIRSLTRYLQSVYADAFTQVVILAPESEKTVLIIGAGLSGLACGVAAVQSGHRVIICSMPDDARAEERLWPVTDALERAGVVFENTETVPANRLSDADAVMVSEHDYMDRVGLGGPKANLFCTETESSKKEMPHRIARALDSVESVNRFLAGIPLDWGRGLYSQGGAVKAFRPDVRVGSKIPRLPEEKIGAGFDRDTAREQASRCFGCGRAFEKNQTCWYCLPCELECPTGALTVEIPYLVR